MGSTGGVKLNWPLVGIALAVIGVPMGIAAIQDLGTDRNEEEILAKLGQIDEIAAVDEDGDDDEAGLERAEDIAGQWHEPAMDQAFFDEVFLGGPEESKPALRGPLATISSTEPPPPPDLSRWPRARARWLDSHGMGVEVLFPDDGTAAQVLASRWGEPLIVVGTDDLTRRIWLDPDAHLRLVLEQHDGEARATLFPYVAAGDYIDPRTGRFAFESYPILGATPELLAWKYGPRFELSGQGESGEIECPGIEVSAGLSTCTVVFEDGKAALVTVIVDHSFRADAGPSVFDALRTQLGEVRDQSSDDVSNTWTFGRGYTVTQHAGASNIWIQRHPR